MMTYELDDIEKRALIGKVVDRARADLNNGQPLTEMQAQEPQPCDCGSTSCETCMSYSVAARPPYAAGLTGNLPDLQLEETFADPPRCPASEEERELFRDASSLAYSAIRHSGLWRSLTNEQWDAKAATYGWLVVELLNNLIDEDLTALNAADEEMDSWLKQ